MLLVELKKKKQQNKNIPDATHASPLLPPFQWWKWLVDQWWCAMALPCTIVVCGCDVGYRCCGHWPVVVVVVVVGVVEVRVEGAAVAAVVDELPDMGIY